MASKRTECRVLGGSEVAMNVLITGVNPGSGIGFETAKALVAKGHHVIAGVHTKGQLETAHALPESSDIIFVKLDVDDPADQELAAELEVDAYFGVAGVGVSGSLAEIDMDLVRQAFETNVFSMFAIAQSVLPGMLERGSGRLVFTSSLSCYQPVRFLSVYQVTKATIAMFSSALRQELKMLDTDVSVSVVLPGAYHTGFNQRLVNSMAGWMREGSLFSDRLDEILGQEHAAFDVLERRSLKSLVPSTVNALTGRHPRFRYEAPLSQAIGAKAIAYRSPLLLGAAAVAGTCLAASMAARSR